MSERYKSKCKKFLGKISKKIKPVFKIIRHRSESKKQTDEKSEKEGRIWQKILLFYVKYGIFKIKGN